MTSALAKERAEAAVRYRKMALRQPSREEEFLLVHRAHAGDRAARDRLARSVLALITGTVMKMKLGTLQVDDVVQEGMTGVARAVDLFDPARGVRFSTYAIFWARAYILKYLATARSVVRPRQGDVAQGDFSLDEPVGDDGSLTHGDLVPDDGPGPEALHMAADYDARVRRALAALRKRLGPMAWDIVQDRLSQGQDGARLEDLARRYGVSRERIRQVELKARELLERYLRAVGLDGGEPSPAAAKTIAAGPASRLLRARAPAPVMLAAAVRQPVETRPEISGPAAAAAVSSALRGLWSKRMRQRRAAEG